MKLGLEIAAVVAATLAVCLGAAPVVARGLRLQGLPAQLATTVIRFSAALALAAGLAALASEHRVALVFTVGATYFAAITIDGVRKFRNRETRGCSTR